MQPEDEDEEEMSDIERHDLMLEHLLILLNSAAAIGVGPSPAELGRQYEHRTVRSPSKIPGSGKGLRRRWGTWSPIACKSKGGQMYLKTWLIYKMCHKMKYSKLLYQGYLTQHIACVPLENLVHNQLKNKMDQILETVADMITWEIDMTISTWHQTHLTCYMVVILEWRKCFI